MRTVKEKLMFKGSFPLHLLLIINGLSSSVTHRICFTSNN